MRGLWGVGVIGLVAFLRIVWMIVLAERAVRRTTDRVPE
jgi:hypothetical protein